MTLADDLLIGIRAGDVPHALSRYRIALAQIPDPLYITREGK